MFFQFLVWLLFKYRLDSGIDFQKWSLRVWSFIYEVQQFILVLEQRKALDLVVSSLS